MKTRFLFVLVAFIYVSFRADAISKTIVISPSDTLIVISLKEEVVMDSVQQQPADLNEDSIKSDITNSNIDDVSAFTLAANTVNNGFTMITVIVGILSFFVAIVGLFGYYELKKKTENAIFFGSIFRCTEEYAGHKQAPASFRLVPVRQNCKKNSLIL